MLKEGMELDGVSGLDQDTNNNKLRSREKSYSLRPRAGTKKDDEEFEAYDAWRPRGGAAAAVGANGDASRSKKRLKQKPQPLSKYRRKTANARERSRMREINEAFEALRRIIPHLGATTVKGGAHPHENNSEKLTKISTLRSAMKYISALRRILQEPGIGGCDQGYGGESDGDAESLLSDCLTPFDTLTTVSNTSNPFSDHILTPTFDLDDSVGSLGVGGTGFETPSPYNSCFSTSNFADHDSDDSTRDLIESNLSSSVFDTCLDVPVFGTQFS